MNDIVMRLRGSLWWLVPLILLAVLLGFETDFGRSLYPSPAPETPVAAKPVVVSVMPEFAIEGGTEKRRETVERTLFNPTRRPAPVAAAEVAKPIIQRGQFTLTGTTVSGDRSLAFLREVKGGKARTVKLGDTINGMLVAEVKPDRVRLTMADESEELVLKVAANPHPTPQPAGAPHFPGQPALPGQPAVGQAEASAPTDVPRTLADRRRAARAAEAAAAEANARQQAAQQGAAAGAPVTAPVPANGTTAQPDPGWAAVFQRYQQRRN